MSAVKRAARRAPDKSERRVEAINLEDPPLSVELRRSAAARRLSLTVSHIDGRARLTAPRNCPRSAAVAFLRDHRDWLRGAMSRALEVVILTPGAEVPYQGRSVLIKHSSRRGVRLSSSGVLEVGGPESQVGARVAAWLKEEARAALLSAVQRYSEALDTPFARISMRDTRSRWGSCSSNGSLSFSWRLILAPPDVLDYVAAHEVAHLIEMNHSPRFWAVVERLRPDWRSQRDWLRLHGSELHRYRVE
ncbi:MAG: M48 family metallopeptidase [Rhodobacteraceae bacterium]|nr:M48 family metallopeptidase [Paracoccaceae bacterium]